MKAICDDVAVTYVSVDSADGLIINTAYPLFTGIQRDGR